MGQPTGFKTFIFVFIFVMFSASIFSLQNINTSDSPIYPLIHYDNVFQITCDWEHAYVGCSAKENSNIGTVWRELLLVTRNTGPSCRGIIGLVTVIILQGTVLCPARAPQATWGGESLSQLFPFLTGDLSSLSLSSPESLCLHCCLCLWRKSLPNVPVFNLLTFSPPTWVKALVLKAKNGQIQFSGVGPLCSDWCILVWNC